MLLLLLLIIIITTITTARGTHIWKAKLCAIVSGIQPWLFSPFSNNFGSFLLTDQ